MSYGDHINEVGADPFSGRLWVPESVYAEEGVHHRRIKVMEILTAGIVELEHTGHKGVEKRMLDIRNVAFGGDPSPWPGILREDYFKKYVMNVAEVFTTASSWPEAYNGYTGTKRAM
jgi:hypothetical protein